MVDIVVQVIFWACTAFIVYGVSKLAYFAAKEILKK